MCFICQTGEIELVMSPMVFDRGPTRGAGYLLNSAVTTPEITCTKDNDTHNFVGFLVRSEA